MDASAEWVIAWTDLILDSTALSEAAREGDLAELQRRAESIAIRARQHGFEALSEHATQLAEHLTRERGFPRTSYKNAVEEIARYVDAIGRDARPR